MDILITFIRELLVPENLILGCGLFAFIGTDSSQFSWDKFNILGLYNDSRGGDACGRVYNNTAQHGVGLNKLYKDFVIAAPEPIEPVSNTVLGHCRRVSVGGFSDIYAQPIMLRKKDINFKAVKDTQLKKIIRESAHDDDIIFSGIHNGTIHNYRDLAPKYGISLTDHNDSMVLLTALFYGHYDILSEYRGMAAVVWHNHITGKTYIFKGASYEYSTSTVVTEERPLFIWEISKDNYYLSSLENSLHFIGCPKDKAESIIPNTIIVLKNGVKEKSIKIDRSKEQQSSYVSTYNNNRSTYSRGGYSKYDEKAELFGNYTGLNNRVPVRIHPATKGVHALSDIPRNNDVHLAFIRMFDASVQAFRWGAEKNTNMHHVKLQTVMYNKGRYWLNGALMHGIYPLSSSGYMPSDPDNVIIITKLYYFIEGIMLDGPNSYDIAKGIYNGFKDSVDNLFISDSAFINAERRLTQAVSRYSKYPTAPLLNLIGTQDTFTNMVSGTAYYSGEFNPLFSNRRYVFNGGILRSIQSVPTGTRTANHDSVDKSNVDAYMERMKKYEKTYPTEFPMDQIGYNILMKNILQNEYSPIQRNIIHRCSDWSCQLEIELFMSHYIRDFDATVHNHCRNCAHSASRDLTKCLSCKEVTGALLMLKYEVEEIESLRGIDVARDEELRRRI